MRNPRNTETEVVGELPHGLSRKLNDCWAVATANPGQWVKTTLQGHYSKVGFETASRNNVTYVRYVGNGKP